MKYRQGFTLVELTVVIMIMTILTAMTLAIVNVTQNSDRVRAASSQIQSYVEGARNRAVHNKSFYGVRVLYDVEGSNVYGTGLVYVEAKSFSTKDAIVLDDEGEPLNTGQVRIGTPNDPRLIVFDENYTKAKWDNLADRKLIGDGTLIWIMKRFYTLEVSGVVGNHVFRLTKNFPAARPFYLVDYSLNLNPAVAPNQQSLSFPKDVVIDLSNSQIPTNWVDGNSFDILFLPDGKLAYYQMDVGFLNLVVAEGIDVFQDRMPGDSTKEGEERIVSIHSKTGSAIVSHVDPSDRNNNGKADDPFNYALLGQPAR